MVAKRLQKCKTFAVEMVMNWLRTEMVIKFNGYGYEVSLWVKYNH